jgi:hypothetical protein
MFDLVQWDPVKYSYVYQISKYYSPLSNSSFSQYILALPHKRKAKNVKQFTFLNTPHAPDGNKMFKISKKV